MMQKENASLQDKLSSVQNNLGQTTTELKTTKASLTDLQKRYDQLNQDHITLQSKLETLSANSKNESQSLQKELDNLKSEHSSMQSILTAFDKSHQMSTQGGLLANDSWSQKLQRMQDLSEIIESETAQLQTLYMLLIESAIVAGNGFEVIQSKNRLMVRMSADKAYRKTSILNTKAQSVIKEVTGIVLRNSNLNVEIQGHTDDQGSDNANWSLSVLRAASVAKQMVKHDFPANRITALGRSSHDPINPEKTDAARQLNRRVEIIIKPHTAL